MKKIWRTISRTLVVDIVGKIEMKWSIMESSGTLTAIADYYLRISCCIVEEKLNSSRCIRVITKHVAAQLLTHCCSVNCWNWRVCVCMVCWAHLWMATTELLWLPTLYRCTGQTNYLFWNCITLVLRSFSLWIVVFNKLMFWQVQN